MRKNLVIGPSWAGLTVQEAVRRALPEVGVREAFKKCRTGEITLDGKSCKPLDRVEKGALLVVSFTRERKLQDKEVLIENLRVETASGPLTIVREDEDLLIVSKDAGCASHPALRRSLDTLVERVWRYLGVNPDDPFKPALANRLDIDTSGLVLIGKNQRARASLGHDLQKRRIEKRYLALVAGATPPEGDITIPLEKKPDSRDLATYPIGHERLSPRIQEAHTRYTLLATAQNPLLASLVEVELLTGRTHQIRRHFALSGHPVALDRAWGNPHFNADAKEALSLRRMFLHAHLVRLPHPITRTIIEVVSPLPTELVATLTELGLGAYPLRRQ